MKKWMLVIVVTVFAACHVTKPYQRPAVDVPVHFRGDNTSDTSTIATLPWQQVFTDTLLQQFISEGIRNNLDLKVAYSKVMESQAYWQQSRLTGLPALNAGVNASFASGVNNNDKSTPPQLYEASLTASWEADVWGKLRSTRKASLAVLLQSTENARAVQSALVANIALSYYQLQALDEQLAVTTQSVINWQQTVDVMTQLKKADVVTGAAIVQSEASKYATKATLPDLQQAIAAAENQLCYLLGRPAGPVLRNAPDSTVTPQVLQTGVPVQLLSNRPDVRAAEDNFRYYFELTNVARTAFYPAVMVTGTGGILSRRVLFDPASWVSSLVAGLTQPVFNQGINKARLKAAREQQQQAAWGFENALLLAGREVGNVLASYTAAQQKLDTRRAQLYNLRQSVAYTQELVKYGFANYTEVLTAQQNLLSGQLSQIADHLQEKQAVVSLYNALGGGWR